MATWDRDAVRKAVIITAASVVVPVAGYALWQFTERNYNKFAPFEYQYRPGTITGYISQLLDKHAKRRKSRAPIRVYMDGCFDMMHYGHANALRQAKALGDELVVGLVPDSEIVRCKGPPVQDEAERYVMVESVKWVDEVLTGVPYDLTPEFLNELLTKHRIDYVVHGDDPCLLPDGTDAYAHVKQQGRFRMIKRTEGVSSTDLVGRMLMCTRTKPRMETQESQRKLAKQFSRGRQDSEGSDDETFPPPTTTPPQTVSDAGEAGPSSSQRPAPQRRSTRTVVSSFMPTSRRIVQFSAGNHPAPPGARIVYIDGAFDLFHVGHVKALKAAKEAGDFLLVGLHADEVVTERRGEHSPIMDLHERSLSVLGCKYVDEIIMGAPSVVTEDLLTTFNISLVLRGTISETSKEGRDTSDFRYAVSREKGIFRTFESPDSMTSGTIIQRIVDNRRRFEEKNARKSKAEATYYSQHKGYIAEV